MNNSLIPEYKVGELVNNIKIVIEGAFSYIKVIGEISDFKKSSSGHYYFNLKENDYLINCVLFKNNLLNTNLIIENGLEIVIYGKLTTYINRSNYQIIIESVRINGEGQLQKIIEDRKKKLKKEGFFDRKRKLPSIFKNVGIITSEHGAAIKDVEIKLKERLPLNIYLYPSLVQGNEAENNIIKGIEFFNKNYNYLDAIIITRGGGSADDLMCFNGENLAKAVFNSKIPTISAVGHEIDWTIIDFVADLRLPTPTAVGEFLSPLKSECEKKLNYVFLKILRQIFFIIEDFNYKVIDISNKIKQKPIDIFIKKMSKYKNIILKFEKFNKTKILKLGYSLVLKNSKIVNYKTDLQLNDELTVKIYKKTFKVKITKL